MTGGETDGQTDGQTGGQTDEQTDGQTDRHVKSGVQHLLRAVHMADDQVKRDLINPHLRIVLRFVREKTNLSIYKLSQCQRDRTFKFVCKPSFASSRLAHYVESRKGKRYTCSWFWTI